MRCRVPAVHAGQHQFRLMHDLNRRFGDHAKFRVSHDDGHFEHAVRIRIQTRHFHVDPHQIEFGEVLVASGGVAL
jgi:hypothetical protein